ncbi:MAG: NAD(P)-binding domain-containing protein, partial [Clostridium paraputrificum]
MDSNISSKIFGEDTINICVLGGGNIGTLLIGYLGQNSGVNVSLYTSRTDKWSNKIDVYDSSDNLKYTSILKNVSSDPKEVISNADIIISTLPSQVFPVVLKSIEDYIREGTWIGVMPGSGGVEFYCKELIEKKECVLFGFQRVHGISR